MTIITNTFLIIDKHGSLIAKGTPRNRYICHIDENDKKRFLTYSSEGKANSAFKNSGFYLSEATKQYIKENYPEIIEDTKWLSWNDIKHLFIVKEYKVIYEPI